MRYALKDGSVLRGESAEDIVRAMLALSFFAPPGERAFMRRFAQRAKLWNGKAIDWKTADRFIASLVATGFLVKLEDITNGKKEG